MKYLASLLVGLSLAVYSLYRWAQVDTLTPVHVFAALVVYVASSLLITWSIADTLRMIRRDLLKR